MNTMKKILCLLLCAVLMLSVLAGCGKKDASETTAPTGSGVAGTYTVNVKSAGGMAMSGLDIYVYADEALTDMKQFGKTDDKGTVSFQLDGKDSYYVSVAGAPKGYQVEKSYSFSGTTADIKLTSALITEETLSDVSALGLGDVMYDFSYTTPDGTTAKLSDMLAEKDAVLINFWFASCGPCGSEFPYMETAYQTYKDDMGIIALSYIDDSAAVGAYQSSMGLSFPMASCNSAWPSIFGISNYPTTVVVDRYGVIALIEVGALTSLRPFTSLMEHFIGDDYEQKLCVNGVSDVISVAKPTETMPSSDEIAAVLNSGDIQATYRGEEDDEMNWPFIITEVDGVQCLKASNQQMDDTYAIMYADVYLEAGQAVGFDYICSTENGGDFLHVIVNENPIHTISGYNETPVWETRYAWVAEEAGTYEVAFCYIKDSDSSEADDTVYIKNLHVISVDDISVPTYLPREAAVSVDGFEFTYADVVLNEADGYYHVGTKDGPLLLATLMDYSQFDEEKTLWDICYEGAAKEYYEDMVDYFSYASNSRNQGVCTVNEELAELLKKVVDVAGFEDNENEWLKVCKYYQAYGTNGQQLEDPIKGLAPFCAYEAKLGKNIPTNSFTYSKIIMPRGYIARFTPSQSGVYRITSRSEAEVEGWIFNENRDVLYTYEFNERSWEDSDNISMLYYMEAGEDYYIDIAFWDPYGEGTVPYDIEFVGTSFKYLSLCAPGYFTYDSDATGDAMYDIIAGGIDVVLGSDGYYYEDLGNGNPGSKIYADFEGLTSVFSSPVLTVGDVKGMVDMGGFDFSKTEQDNEILAYLAKHDGDVEKTDAFLRQEWGEDYDENAKQYMIEDIFDGIYHGSGEDYTDAIRAYGKKVGTSGELKGLVAVDKELAEILQMLMDKYTFEGVENSWIKICYYYRNISK